MKNSQETLNEQARAEEAFNVRVLEWLTEIKNTPTVDATVVDRKDK